MDETNMDLDYQKMYEELLGKFSGFFEMQHEYFDMLTKVQELGKYNKAVADNIMKMSMADQIKLLRVALKQSEIAKEMCDKYDFEVEGDDDGNQSF